MGKLRLVYSVEGDLWLLDEGQPADLLQEGNGIYALMLSPSGSQIVFVRQRDEVTSEAWVVDATGGSLRQLSPHNGIPGSIDVISFSDDEQLVALAGQELWIADLREATARRLVDLDVLQKMGSQTSATSVEFYRVAWIPDSHRLIYVPVLRHGDPSGGDAGPPYEPVHLADAGSGELGVLYPTGEGGQISFSPDGKTMVISDPAWVRLSGIDLPGEPRTVLEYAPICGVPDCYIPQPTWASDKRFLIAISTGAFDEVSWAGPFVVWQVSDDGSEALQLRELSRASPSFHYSPDLTWLAYQRVDATWQLHLASVNGSADMSYPAFRGIDFHGWSPDSRHFAYSAVPGRLMRGDVCGGQSPLTDFADAEFIGWIDADRFLMHVAREGVWDLYLGAAGEQSTRLVQFGASILYGYVVITEQVNG